MDQYIINMNFYIIGIDDNQKQFFPPGVGERIARGKVFSGNSDHYEIVKSLLPVTHTWIEIRSPLAKVFEQYKPYKEVIIFASGDPLFFGFAGTIKRNIPMARIKLHPFFNSLQMLSNRMMMSYEDMHVVSLTGRSWHDFDRELIEGAGKIGVLTDREKTPRLVAERMIRYGYTNYNMSVGELLGNREYERVRTLNLQEILEESFNFPNCVILQKQEVRHHSFGVSEQEFESLSGTERMITKLPVRLFTLSMLDLSGRNDFWDIGFSAGSISIEAKLQFPHLRIMSFEVQTENSRLKEKNSIIQSTPGITPITGDFLKQDLSQLEAPDAVFIGMHGGRLAEIVEKVYPKLASGGVLVFNSVSELNQDRFIEAITNVGMILERNNRITVDDYNKITILKAVKR